MPPLELPQLEASEDTAKQEEKAELVQVSPELECFSTRTAAAVTTGFLCNVFLGGVYYSSQTLLPHLIEAFPDESRGHTAGVFSGHIFGTTFSMIIGGGIAERYGMVPSLVGGFALFITGLILDGVGTSITIWYVGHTLAGLGFGTVFVAAIALVPAHTPANRRGICVGVSAMGVGVGNAAMNTLLAVLITAAGLRAAMLLVAAGSVLVGAAVVFLARYLERQRSRKVLPGASRSVCGAVGRWFFNSVWLRLFLGMLLLLFGFDIPFVALKQLALDLDVSEDDARVLPVVLGLSNGLGRALAGIAGDALGDYHAVMTLMAVGCGVSLTVLPACADLEHLVGFSVSYGLTAGGRSGLLSCVVCQLFGSDQVASAYGALAVAFTISEMLGPLAAGAVYDSAGSYDPATYLAAGLTYLAALVFASLLDWSKVTHFLRRCTEKEGTSPQMARW